MLRSPPDKKEAPVVGRGWEGVVHKTETAFKPPSQNFQAKKNVSQARLAAEAQWRVATGKVVISYRRPRR